MPRQIGSKLFGAVPFFQAPFVEQICILCFELGPGLRPLARPSFVDEREKSHRDRFVIDLRFSCFGR
ncbi:MAG TPA: hypothetical protein VF751_03125 [Chthoniobacterales bacterium]